VPQQQQYLFMNQLMIRKTFIGDGGNDGDGSDGASLKKVFE
jgi:hypothetical protein